eukprot:Nk52_evm3s371 gene=Nk52_evmTU3s371
MPLLKRKPYKVTADVPKHLDDDDAVFYIRFTNEVFVDYEAYINKLNSYRSRQWACKTTGKTNLTFEEALESEHAYSKSLARFPETHLKEVLRCIQYSTLRGDQLVESIFTKFSKQYLPNEHIQYVDENGEVNEDCVVVSLRKSAIGDIDGESESKNMATSNLTYEIRIPKKEGTIWATEGTVSRKKHPLQKEMIRRFIRECSTRDTWVGAPFVVKAEYVKKHQLEGIEYPRELLEQKAKFEQRAKLKREREEEEEADKESGKGPVAKRRRKLPKSEEELQKIKEEKQRVLEEERRKRKIRYPIEDTLLSDDDEHLKFPRLATDFVVPEEFVGLTIMVSEFVCMFTKVLKVTPFAPEDFANALISDCAQNDPFLSTVVTRTSEIRYSRNNNVGTLSGLCTLIEETLCGLINCIFGELEDYYFIDEGAVEDEYVGSGEVMDGSDNEGSTVTSNTGTGRSGAPDDKGSTKKVNGLLPVLSREVTGEDWEENVKRFLVRKHKMSKGSCTPICLIPYLFNGIFLNRNGLNGVEACVAKETVEGLCRSNLLSPEDCKLPAQPDYEIIVDEDTKGEKKRQKVFVNWRRSHDSNYYNHLRNAYNFDFSYFDLNLLQRAELFKVLVAEACSTNIIRTVMDDNMEQIRELKQIRREERAQFVKKRKAEAEEKKKKEKEESGSDDSDTSRDSDSDGSEESSANEDEEDISDSDMSISSMDSSTKVSFLSKKLGRDLPPLPHQDGRDGRRALLEFQKALRKAEDDYAKLIREKVAKENAEKNKEAREQALLKRKKMEEDKAEAMKVLQHEANIARLYIHRVDPIGLDRLGRRYYVLDSDPKSIYVEYIDIVAPPPKAAKKVYQQQWNENLSNLESEWGRLTTSAEVTILSKALKRKGIRELKLSKNLEKYGVKVTANMRKNEENLRRGEESRRSTRLKDNGSGGYRSYVNKYSQ